MKITSTPENDFDFATTRIGSGEYRVTSIGAAPLLLLMRDQLKTDATRVQHSELKIGQVLYIPVHANGFWSGISDCTVELLRSLPDRCGKLAAKRNKTDPSYETVSVIQRDGEVFIYDTIIGDWTTIPAEWIPRIQWEDE